MIELRADASKLYVTAGLDNTALVSGMANVATVQVTFSAAWAGLDKVLVFTDGKKTIIHEMEADDEIVPIPHEVLEVPGRTLYIGAQGTDGEQVILPTMMCRLKSIALGADPNGDTTTVPPKERWKEIKDELEGLVQDAEDEADRAGHSATSAAGSADDAAEGARAAAGSADEAAEKVRDAEAWAKGTRNGAAVPSTDPAYNNSAKYWKDQAQATALAITEQAIADWLDAHPEATTTVEDGSITEAKLTNLLKTKALNDFINPKQFGAIGDGTTDDTQALLDCAEYCAENKKMMLVEQGDTIYLPNATTISGVKQIRVEGKIKAPNGVTFAYKHTKTGNDWYFNEIDGTLTLMGLKDSLITVISASKVALLADARDASTYTDSIAYNLFFFGYVYTLELNSYDRSGVYGWINENVFYGGRIHTLTVQGYYSHNNNHWYNNTFEGGATIDFYVGSSNYIHNARFEGPGDITFHEAASNNYVHRAWQATTLPGVSSLPSYWKDLGGKNYFCYSVYPAVKTYTKQYTANSYNYDTGKMYPTTGNKLHTLSYKFDALKTNIFSVAHSVGVNIKASVKYYRMICFVYDSNGDVITSQPTYSPFGGVTFSWSNNLTLAGTEFGPCYYITSENLKDIAFSISRYNMTGSNDTGVCYAKISLWGYASVDLDYLSMDITAPWYTKLEPFELDKLTGTAQPTNGVWNDGTLVYNTNPSNSLLGWYYNNGAWHTLA